LLLPFIRGDVVLHGIVALGVDADGAVMFLECGCVYLTFDVDQAVNDAAARCGGQLHRPAVGFEHACVLYQLLLHRIADSYLQELVAVEVEGERIARCQLHLAELGRNDAAVLNIRGN